MSSPIVGGRERLVAHVSKDLYSWIEHEAERKNRSLSDHTRQLLEDVRRAQLGYRHTRIYTCIHGVKADDPCPVCDR